MKWFFRLVLLLAISAALISCNQSVNVVGQYQGTVEILGQSDSGVENDILTSLAESAVLKLELNRAGTYREEYLFFTLTGNYKVNGDQLTITPETLNDVNLADVADDDLRLQGNPKTFQIKNGKLIRKSPDGEYQETYELIGSSGY